MYFSLEIASVISILDYTKTDLAVRSSCDTMSSIGYSTALMLSSPPSNLDP